MKYYLEALRIQSVINDKIAMTNTYNNLGTLYGEMGKHETAIEYYQKGLLYGRETKKQTEVSNSLHQIGNAFLQLKQRDNGLNYLQQAIKLREEIQDKRGLSQSYTVFADELRKVSQNGEALVYYQKAGKIASELGLRLELAVLQRNMAEILETNQRYDSAITTALQAKSIFDSIGVRADVLRSCEVLSRSYEKNKEYDKALFYNRQASILRDSILNKENLKQINELQTKYDTERKDKEIAILNRDKEIQELMTRNQRNEILRQRILADQQKQDILLLNSEKQISTLQLTQRESDLNKERLVNQQKEQSLQLLTQEKALAEAQVQRQTLIRNALLGLVALLAVIAALVINRFRLKRRADAEIQRKNEEIAALERTQALERERRRISQDIHDEVGSGLTKILMLSQNAADTTQPNKEISTTAQGVIDGMQEIIWSINPKNDTLQSLVAFIRSYGREFVSAAGMSVIVETPVDLATAPLKTDVRRNVFLAVKEALNNAVKYSAATEIRIGIAVEPSSYIFTIVDNGRGFAPDVERLPTARGGNGLENMRLRMEEIGGGFHLDSAPNEGTKIILSVTL